MTKVVITRPGNLVVDEFTALTKQPVTPSTAAPADIGLVEISQSRATELIPGPPGAKGDTGPVGPVGPQGTTDWNDLTNKPPTFPPTVPIDWSDIANEPATFPPTLPIPWTDVSGKPATFPPSAHGHAFTEITGTVTDAQHGNRGGGALHAAATAATPGFFTDAASDGTQYVRKNGAWAAVTVPPGTYIGDNPPPSPTNGQEWWQSSTGMMLIFYVDAGGGAGQWVQTNAAPANMPPVPPSDGGEYVMANGVWRLKAQSFYPTGLAGQIITVPTTAKRAKISGQFYSASAAGMSVYMRVSVDGTTFLSGATDYNSGGMLSYSGSNASPAKSPYAGGALWALATGSDVANVPIVFTGELVVGKGPSPQVFAMQWRGQSYSSPTTQLLLEYMLMGFVTAAAASAITQLPAFQIYPSAVGWAAGSTISVEWIY